MSNEIEELIDELLRVPQNIYEFLNYKGLVAKLRQSLDNPQTEEEQEPYKSVAPSSKSDELSEGGCDRESLTSGDVNSTNPVPKLMIEGIDIKRLTKEDVSIYLDNHESVNKLMNLAREDEREKFQENTRSEKDKLKKVRREVKLQLLDAEGCTCGSCLFARLIDSIINEEDFISEKEFKKKHDLNDTRSEKDTLGDYIRMVIKMYPHKHGESCTL